MSRLDDCLKRVTRCTTTVIEKCVATRDEGHNECIQERDDGYRDCCGWIPCRWFCRVWTWIKHIVCVVARWISFIVCVGWEIIKSVICTFWGIVTLPLCMVSLKVARFLDGVGNLAKHVLEGAVGAATGAGGGIAYFFTHPGQAAETIANIFRGCPSVRSAVVAAGGSEAILCIAHHGYTDIWPENTAQSCNAAMRRGADALEVDLCFTADGQVILWHDWSPDAVISLARQADIGAGGSAYLPDVPPLGSEWRKAVDELSLADFRAHYGYQNDEDGAVRIRNDIAFGPRDTAIPTLGEFMRDVDREPLRMLLLDVKMPGSAEGRAGEMLDAIHAALTEAEFDLDKVIVMVPEFAVLEAMKQRSESRDYGLAFTWDVEYPAGVILNPRRYSAVDHAVTPFHNAVASVGRPAAALFPWKTYRLTIEHDIGRWNAVNADPAGQNAGRRISHLIAWTIDDEDEMRCLVRMGVSGIITNKTERLARVLGR